MGSLLLEVKVSKHKSNLSRSVISLGMRRREFLITLGIGSLGLAAASFLKGCSGSESGGGGGGVSVPPTGSVNSNFTIMTNSSDPLLATAETSDGRVMEFYGTRDVSGKPSSVDQIFIRSANGDAIQYDLDSTGRPTKIFAVDGTQFLLNWISPTEVALAVISSDGTTQVNTTVDFTQASNNAALELASLTATATTTQKDGSTPRGGRRVTLQFSPRQTRAIQSFKTVGDQKSAGISPLMGAIQTAQGVGDGTCTVQVTSCELPEENADVYVDVLDDDADRKFLGQFRATRVSAGTYQATIPTDRAPTINPSEICQDLAFKLGIICDVAFTTPGAAAFFCLRLGIVLASTVILAPIALKITAACSAVTFGFDLYCNTIGGGPVPGAESLVDLLCKAKTLNRTFISDIILQPRVIGLPNSIVGASATAPGQGPYPNLTVNLGSKTAVRSFTLTPSSPGAGVGYVGTADIFCLPAGTTVTLSVIGTDEYQDTTSTTIPLAQREGTFTLSVPGAESGIQDTVTLAVIRSDGQNLTYTASLVFG